jgi:hypothetical protein
MPTRRHTLTFLAAALAAAAATVAAPGAVAQAQTDNSSYIVFVHSGAAPEVHDAGDRVLAVLKGLLKAGYSVRKPDSERDVVGGPGVDYFNDNDLTAAQAIADIVNAAMPDRQKIAPRRQRVNNPPHYFGVWLF